ncbi:MAG: fumarate hydratase [Candidatus Omnitrophica bacterium]|nr:fumarate hydratase [Candidatus Omnitrophota bacterium]
MRIITAEKIKDAIADLCIEANLVLRRDVLLGLQAAYAKERNKRAKDVLKAITTNAYIARRDKIAICQDTGLPAVFLEIGQGVKISGDLNKAINRGVAEGYKRGSLRNSIISDPLSRGKSGYSPAVIHTEITRGNKLKVTVLPKGFGCENKAQLKMFNPTVKFNEIEEFVVDVVKSAGADACPPYVVGVGIGATADYAMLMAKRALLKPIGCRFNKLEKDLMKKINKLNIGPMGLGGNATCLGVNIETYPTHIAGLPVAVNISCHALRSASRTL